jgi:hypothetical protein
MQPQTRHQLRSQRRSQHLILFHPYSTDTNQTLMRMPSKRRQISLAVHTSYSTSGRVNLHDVRLADRRSLDDPK